MRKLVLGAILVGATFSGTLATPAHAGGGKGAAQYAAALSCGTADGLGGAAAGTYFTSISVLNAGSADATTNARVTLTSANESSDSVGATLAPGAALQLDCADLLSGIFTFPTPPTGFSEGFLVIQSSAPLQVVARYTTSGGSSQVVPIAAAPTWRGSWAGSKDKEEICHVPPGDPSNEHTIRVSKSAVPAHMRHGDHSGECDDDNDDQGEDHDGD